MFLLIAARLIDSKIRSFAQQTDLLFCRTGSDRSLEEDSQGPQEDAGKSLQREVAVTASLEQFAVEDKDAGLPFECAGRHAEPLPD